MQFIKDNVMALVLGVLVVVLLLTGISLASTKTSLASTQAQLTTAKANQLVLQSDLDTATIELKEAEKEKERIRLDAALTARTLVVREQGRNEVDAQMLDTTSKVATIIEESEDEAITTWAATDVPDELNRLLKRSSYCANGDHHQDGVCVAAAGIDERMRGTDLLRQEEPRSL